MRRWQQLTFQGNQLFRDGHYQKAEVEYNKALDLSRHLLAQWYDPQSAITALVISYQNLADSCIKQNEAQRAAFYLLQAHKILQGMSHTTETDSDWHSACQRGIYEVAASVKNLLAQCPDAKLCEQCQRAIFPNQEKNNYLHSVH